MSKEAELSVKRSRVAELMERQHLAGLLLARNSSVSWAMAGNEAPLTTGSETATAAILYTPQRDFLLAEQGSMPRLLAEALPGLPFEPLTLAWYKPDEQQTLLAELTGGGTVASDVPLPGVTLRPQQIAALRSQLTLEEQIRLRELSIRAGAALEAAAGEITPGISEYAMAGLLGEECYLRDITPLRLLAAVDERALHFRSPVPSSKTLERYARLSLTARHAGLLVSLTRLVHFGAIPADLRQRGEACATINAAAIAATRPGARADQVFAAIEEAYTSRGFVDEWQQHHQGGAAGYEPREWLARPDSPERIHENQAFIWTSSLPGVISEDLVLVQGERAELLTRTPHWPTLFIQVGDIVIERPDILEVD